MSLLATPIRLLLALWCAAAMAAVCLPARAQVAGAQGAPAAEAAQRRVALVIGNNDYETSPLKNSINDARAMAGVLRDAGFMVMLLTDVDQRQFQLALREFGERLKSAGSGGAGLFYYAGHGVQIKGRNFLIPVRSHVTHEDEVAYAAVDAQAVLDKMESAGNGTNIVILDACRDNPFTRSTRGGTQGLAQMDAPVGTLVAYATAPGSVAVDSRPGMNNGLYTTHLLEAVRRRGLKVEDVFKQVRNAVLRASANKQQPWESTALVGDFYFHPPGDGAAAAVLAPVATLPATPAAPPPDPQASIDDALWEAVKDSRSSAELFAYLNRFPGGRHAREARRRLLDLAQPGAAATGTGASTSPNPSAGNPAGGAAATTITDTQWRMSVEEEFRWGRTGTDVRPANPRRNAIGFAEGDRFRYQKTDYLVNGGVTKYLWTVNSFEPDGSMSINGGRQRFDAQGQRLGGNDEQTGVWLDLSAPLPLLDLARRGAGIEQPFSTTATVREHDGRVERVLMKGRLRTDSASVSGPRGTDLLSAVRVDVELDGRGQSSDGAQRFIHWRHSYWMALPFLLPVTMSILEMVDGQTRQNTRHELIVVDQLSLSELGAPGVAPALGSSSTPTTTRAPLPATGSR